MTESAPQLPEDDIEAAAQQPVPDENAPADGDKSSHSYQLPEMTYEQGLYYYVRENKSLIDIMGYVEFEDLSKMNIVHLMNELAKYDQATRKDDAAPQDMAHVGDLLHRYTTAVQDREYWSRLPKYRNFGGGRLYNDLQQSFVGIYGGQGDLKMAHLKLAQLGGLPKSTSGSIDPLRSFLGRVLPKRLTWTNDERKRRFFLGYLGGKTPEDLSPFVDTLARFIVAITGGLSLVVPMLIMRLDEHLKKSLITVSVAVILFSALTSLMFKASNVETLAATAAYAAVLVVFVGTSS